MQGRFVFSAPRRPMPITAMRMRPCALAVVGMLVLLQLAPAARADTLPPQFMAQYDAAQAYLQLLQDADAANSPEQLDSPHTLALLAAVTDRRGILEQAYTPQDLGLLAGACEYGKTLKTRLMLFGAPTDPVAVLMQTGQLDRLQQLGAHNAERFNAHLQRLLPYLLQCGARMQPLLDQWLGTASPAELAGLGPGGADTLRQNAQRQYLEILAVVTAQPGPSALKQTLVTALAEAASAYARMLQPAQRLQVKQALGEAAAQVDGRYVTALESAADAFNGGRCGTLCRM
ncbi:hypothetical protein KQ945_08995 [Bacillus subtilis subsp. subtilis]|nr:hypothetical protein [Bacillus subtilis subsp. subtilis]